MGLFSCFEVTIGFGGNERVDYMTIDTKNIVRCYEIKSSKQDFYSGCAHTFVGNFNYYVMDNELYELVKDDIPKEIGVHNGSYVIKKPKRKDIKIEFNVLLMSMIRSLSRDADKYYKIAQTDVYENQRKELNRLKNSNKKLKEENKNIQRSFMNFLRDENLVRKFRNRSDD